MSIIHCPYCDRDIESGFALCPNCAGELIKEGGEPGYAIYFCRECHLAVITHEGRKSNRQGGYNE